MGLLSGKSAIITGGGTGIGKGIALEFAKEGCDVVIAARNSIRLDSTAEEIRLAYGSKVLSVQTDVTKENQVERLFNKTLNEMGRLDILVNNSGAFDGAPLDELSLEQWQNVIDVNVTGPFLCSREAFKIMKKNRSGRIINIGSISAQRPREQSVPYTTSKNAVWGLTQASALEGREYGIAVSCLHPGNVAVERRSGGRSSTGKDMGPEPMLTPDQMGRTALLMATLPSDANMLEAIVLPIEQAYLGRG